MGLLVRLAGQTNWTHQLDRAGGQTSWTDQLDGSAGRTSWTDQLFYLKPWPVHIFEDFLFSLYIVAASESDEGLVLKNLDICGNSAKIIQNLMFDIGKKGVLDHNGRTQVY